MLRMNGQFLTVKKEEGLSPVKHGEFVPAKNLKIIVFVRHYENENNDNYKSNQKYM